MKHLRILPFFLLPAFATQAHAAFQSFEGDGFGTWKTTGDAFGLSPVHEKLDGMEKAFSSFSDDSFATSAHGGFEATGTLESPEFTIKANYISFLIAGGKHPGTAAVQLLVDGKIEFESTGENTLRFSPSQWDVHFQNP